MWREEFGDVLQLKQPGNVLLLDFLGCERAGGRVINTTEIQFFKTKITILYIIYKDILNIIS